MASSKREKLKNDIHRSRIRQMRADGVSISKIADELGKSVRYVTMISEQEGYPVDRDDAGTEVLS